MSWAIGMAAVVFLIFAGLALIAWLEWRCEQQGWPSISHRVEEWADRNAWFSGGLVTLVFFLLAHFVLNPLFSDAPIVSP